MANWWPRAAFLFCPRHAPTCLLAVMRSAFAGGSTDSQRCSPSARSDLLPRGASGALSTFTSTHTSSREYTSVLWREPVRTRCGVMLLSHNALGSAEQCACPPEARRGWRGMRDLRGAQRGLYFSHSMHSRRDAFVPTRTSSSNYSVWLQLHLDLHFEASDSAGMTADRANLCSGSPFS